ncbi:tRNA-dihydrouridine(20/20a) synthase [Aeromonas caviae]|nr:tRNA-dihydrouridine(20/20a) synthase [Aeromonas caviae]GJA75346.1 tRNA-dihydrouridine(20/20a) synthase [Aeromonas caviae]
MGQVQSTNVWKHPQMTQKQISENPVKSGAEAISGKPAHRQTFSIAPMLDWTDRHCRYFHRLMTRQTLLYTEMVTTGAIIHGKGDYLGYSEQEHPLALQLGGSNPADLARCARLAEERGYDEVNLNVGCPSDRVQNGRFGACLMGEPALVADCVKAMRDVVDIPVTVKTRIGIDEQDSYEFLQAFIEQVRDAGCDTFIVHARKAWLSGLSPKENREIPPLDYPRVYRVKQDYPELTIAINGGVTSLEQTLEHLQHLDGVMMGREAYQNPYILAQVDNLVFGENRAVPSRHEVVRMMLPYIEQELAKGNYLSHMTRHMLGLFQNMQGARAWRRHLSENACKPGADIQVVLDAMAKVPEFAPADAVE